MFPIPLWWFGAALPLPHALIEAHHVVAFVGAVICGFYSLVFLVTYIAADRSRSAARVVVGTGCLAVAFAILGLYMLLVGLIVIGYLYVRAFVHAVS